MLDGNILYVDGVSLQDSSFLLPDIADRLEIDRSSGQSVGELISEALAGRSLLLVLDNMEHLVAASVDIAALLARAGAAGARNEPIIYPYRRRAIDRGRSAGDRQGECKQGRSLGCCAVVHRPGRARWNAHSQ